MGSKTCDLCCVSRYPFFFVSEEPSLSPTDFLQKRFPSWDKKGKLFPATPDVRQSMWLVHGIRDKTENEEIS